MSNTAPSQDKPLINADKPRQTSTNNAVVNQKEYGGPKGKEPARYGDWEKKGRCIDF